MQLLFPSPRSLIIYVWSIKWLNVNCTSIHRLEICECMAAALLYALKGKKVKWLAIRYMEKRARERSDTSREIYTAHQYHLPESRSKRCKSSWIFMAFHSVITYQCCKTEIILLLVSKIEAASWSCLAFLFVGHIDLICSLSGYAIMYNVMGLMMNIFRWGNKASQRYSDSASWISLRYYTHPTVVHTHARHKGIFSRDLESNIFDKYVPFYHDAVF